MRKLVVVSMLLLLVACTSEEPAKPPSPAAGPDRTPQAQQEVTAKGIEQAFPMDMEGEFPLFGGMEGELVEPLEIMSLAQFEAAWKIDLDVADRPAGEVLEELVQALGMSLEPAGAEEALAKPVTVKLSGCSRLQAIEEVCRLVGFYPSYPEDGPSVGFFGFPSDESPATPTVTLEKGPRPWPATFAGPVLIEVTGIETFPPYATGTLKLAVCAAALPASIRDLFEDEDPEFALEKVASSAGEDLWDEDRMSLSWSMPLVPLKNLLRGVASIDAVAGKLKIPLPTGVEDLQFMKLQPGTSQKGETVQVTLDRVEREESCGLRFAVTNLDANAITWQPLDAQGRSLETGGTSSFFFNQQGQVEVTVEGRPVSLVASVEGKPVRFDKLEAGQQREVGGGRIVLASIRNRESCHLSVSAKGAKSLRIIPRDAEGHPMRVQLQGGSRFGDQAQIELNAEGQPASVTANCLTSVEQVAYELELKNIPLGSLEGMPEKLEPFQFSGHKTPVTVEFVSIVPHEHFPDKKNVKLRAANHSNKDVRRLDMEQTYLDGNGKKLDDFPAVHAGTVNMPTGNQDKVVAKNTAAEFNVSAFFMPEGTKRVSIAVKRVEFSDATVWKAEAAEPP